MRFEVRSKLGEGVLQELFRESWEGESPNYGPEQLEHSLAWVCAFDGQQLVGFVNIAWDGGAHAFILDVTVRPEYRRRSIGTEMVGRAGAIARASGCIWLHVDYEERLADFYEGCGFSPTSAGLMRLTS